jgi:hypothetical protein
VSLRLLDALSGLNEQSAACSCAHDCLPPHCLVPDGWSTHGPIEIPARPVPKITIGNQQPRTWLQFRVVRVDHPFPCTPAWSAHVLLWCEGACALCGGLLSGRLQAANNQMGLGPWSEPTDPSPTLGPPSTKPAP